MAIREGAWDCPYCGRERNRGAHQYCGSCGAARDQDVKFYLPDDARLIEDEAELKRARSGPDWSCAFCKADNPAYQQFCTGCGGGADGSPPRQVSESRHASGGTTSDHDKSSQQRAKGASMTERTSENKTSRLPLFAAILVMVVLGLFFFCRSSSDVGTIVDHSWERQIDIEHLKTRIDEKWDNELPRSNIRELSRSRQVHSHNKIQIGSETRTRNVSEQVQTGTRQVKVGTRDLGNGYFEDIMKDEPIYETVTRQETYQEPIYREEPVYRDKVRFEIDEWKKVKHETAAGGEGIEPRWPEVQVSGAKEREGPRRERYVVGFTLSDGSRAEYETRSESEWKSYKKGQTHNVQVKGDKVVKILPPDS